MTSDLLGWTNEATRDLWAWMVSRRDNLPAFQELIRDSPFMENPQEDLNHFIVRKDDLPEEDRLRLLKLLPLVNWTEFTHELQKLCLEYL